MKNCLSAPRKFAAVLGGFLVSAALLSAQPNGPRPDHGPGDAHGPGQPVGSGAGLDGGASVAEVVSHLTSRLTLTTAQQTQATTLLTQLQTSTATAQTAFSNGLTSVLTAAQLATLKAQPSPVLPGLVGGPDGPGDDIAATVTRLTQRLALTTLQAGQVTTLLTQLYTALTTAQTQFTTAFEAILTPTQLAIYQSESRGGGEPPFGTGVDYVTNYLKYLTSLLALTTDQQTATSADIVKLQSSITAANTAFTTALEAILTATQLALYQKERGPDGLMAGGAPNESQATLTASLVAALTQRLTLTTAQQAQATVLVTQHLAALSAADLAFDTAFESILTATQLAIYQASLTAPSGPGPH
jgi:hypothetical protein